MAAELQSQKIEIIGEILNLRTDLTLEKLGEISEFLNKECENRVDLTSANARRQLLMVMLGLTSDLLDTQNQDADQRTLLRDLDNQVTKLKNRLDVKNSELTIHSEETQELRDSLEKSEELIFQLEDRIKLVETQSTQELNIQKEDSKGLLGRISSLEEQLEAKNEEIELKNTEVSDLNADLDARFNEIASKSHELESKSGNIDQKLAEINDLELKIADLDAKLNQTHQDLDASQGINEEYQVELNESRMMLQQKETELTEKAIEIELKNHEIQVKAQELSDKSNELSVKAEEFDSSCAQISELGLKIEAKNLEVSELHAQIDVNSNEMMQLNSRETEILERFEKICSSLDDIDLD